MQASGQILSGCVILILAIQTFALSLFDIPPTSKVGPIFVAHQTPLV